MRRFLNHKSYIIYLFILAFSLRLYGLNWDQGQHLHPDERFLTMVASDIRLPQNIFDYFNTSKSPLNPYNYSQYQFFVYGTLPLFLTKFIAATLHLDSYDSVYLIGRVLSALFDSFNIILLYYLSKRFLPSILYAFTVLPLQLSHFFTVDTFLTFFILLTFTLLVSKKFFLAPIAFGLALACKISAIYFAPIIVLFFISYFLKTKNLFFILRVTCYVLLITSIVFRIFQPYAFTGLFKINPQFTANIKTLLDQARPDSYFPPAIQWLNRIPLVFSLKNLIFWGLGLPLTLLFFLNLKKPLFSKIALIWIIFLILFQGFQFTPSMRYFLTIYPFICLLSAKYLVKPLILLHCLFGLLFLSIYSRPHSRVQASEWIYQNITPGSRLTSEYWDDSLPLPLPGQSPHQYPLTTLSPYDPDSPEKWQKLNSQINSADYLIFSSNRLWGSIPRVSTKYPITAKFYQDLFDEKLEFKKLIEINSYPGISLPFLKHCYYFGPTNFPGGKNSWFSVDHQCFYPGIYLRDDTAEEAFTVYDHPKVLIFSRADNQPVRQQFN